MSCAENTESLTAMLGTFEMKHHSERRESLQQTPPIPCSGALLFSWPPQSKPRGLGRRLTCNGATVG